MEHVIGHGVQGPNVASSRIDLHSRYLDKAIIVAEVVTDRVLPGWKLVFEIWKPVDDELADSLKTQSLVRTEHDGHGDQCNVRQGRLPTS